jgi:hypothetical protein
MKSLISFALKNNNYPLFEKLWSIYSFIDKNSNNKIWFDKNGNTLAHYACMHHDKKLWEFTKNNIFDLKHLNNDGKAPIHIFIENSFIQNIKKKQKNNIFISSWLFLLKKISFLSKSISNYIGSKTFTVNQYKLSISFDKELLDDLINHGLDINQFLEYPERKELGWTSTDFGAFSIKHILGTPLELLVSLFWEFVIYPMNAKRYNDLEIIDEYNHFFHTLTSLGANPNLIFQGNTNSSQITDAMSSTPSRVVSVFYSKFITSEIDYFAIKPFLVDEHIDFLAVDDHGNTFLHTLFARLSARKQNFSDEFCEQIIMEISKNKNLTTEILLLKNNFHQTPLNLLRQEAEHLRKLFDAFILKEDLGRTLDINSANYIKKKVNKI